MSNYSSMEAMRIAIEYGCKTVKEFSDFIKIYNNNLRVTNG